MKLKLGKWALSILAALILLIPPAPVLSGSPTNSPPGVEGAQVEEIPVKKISQVTLITGDVVTVTANDDGQRSFAVTPANPNQLGQHFLTINQGKDTYIIPDGIDLKKLDMELFNIDYLIDEEYDEEPSLPLLVSYTPKLTKSQAQSLQGKVTALGKGTKLHESVHTLSTRFNYTDIAASYSNLIKQPEVKKIWLNKKVHVKLDDSVPLVGAPWWWSNMGNQGEGMEIAILDTGIDSTHPALDDLDDDPVTTDPKVIVNQNFTDDTGYDDLYGHGTHCAGIAAGTAAGTVYEGMAPKAYLWNVKVLNRYGSGYEDWVIDGIEFASLGPDGTPQTGDEADIISMSLGDGVTDGTDPASQAVNLAVERGVVVVVAAGNYGSSPYTITTPGTADKAFTIAATDKWDDMAYFSSRGPTLAGKLKPDIAAPGVDIVSSVPTGSCPLCDPSGYRSLQGTSMATPHVAGAAALVKQHFGTTATPQFVKDALMSTALDVGHTVYEQGSGRLNLSWDPLPAVWITPATLSLGPYTQEPTCSAIFTFFTTDNVSSHDVSLSVELVDTTGNDYSDNITLNQDTFTIPSGSQVDVNLTIDLTTLPLSRYDGRLTATVDGGTSGEIHAIFGFRKSVTVTVHKIDISGNPAQNHYLYIFPEGMESKPITGYTDDSGNFTFDAFDSTYHVLSRSTDAVNDATIWTIAEDINVIEDPLIELDERNTGVVDFDPNDELEQKPAGKSSNVVLNFDQYAWSFSDSWYYPATFITRVSPCSNCNIGFNYTCYPLADFKPYSPELVNSSDWYNLSYPATGITGDVTFVADHANLVHRETSYCLPLHEERARWYQYCYDNMFYFGTYSYFMDAPQQRWEWLSPNVYYYLYYDRYMSVTGNCWRFPGISTRYTAAGEYSWAIGCHPFSSGIDYAYISWNEPDNYLGIGGNIFRDSYDQDFYNNCAGQPPGHITITQDGNPVVDEDRWDFFSRGFYFSGQPHFTVEVTGQITVDPKGQTKQELSGSSYTRLDFDAVTTHSDYLPPQLLFRVPGIDPYGAVHGGNITVKVQATDSSSVSSLALFSSSDDGNTWQPATLTGISGGWYTFDLGLLQDCFVSLAAEAEDSHGNHIYHRTMSAFYVGTATAQKIIGAEDAPITAAAGSGYLVLGRFAASASSTVSQLRIKCSGPGYVKVAMYSDSTGEPGAMLNAVNTSTPVVAGWNNITFPDTTVTAGTPYWLAFNSDSAIVGYAGLTGTAKYKAGLYSTFNFPTFPGVGFSPSSANLLLAGWGTPPALTIITISLPDAEVGINYSQNLQASGGTGSYTWSKISGDLPDGLTLNSSGLILGTPSATGTFNFTVQVDDGVGISTQPLSITVAPPVERIIGNDDASISAAAGAGYFVLGRFTASVSGIVSQFRIKCSGPGYVKVAMYSDSTGEPGALLNAVNTSTPVVAGWNNITFPDTTVTAGTPYWLAFNSDSAIVGYAGLTGTTEFKAAAYSSFTFPGSAGTGFTPSPANLLLAGWGAPPPTPVAPPILSPGTAITFEWDKSTWATTYWLQVNTASDFTGTDMFNAEVGNVTLQKVTGLSIGTIYYYRVKAGNSSGWSAWSSVRRIVADVMP